MTSNCSQLCKTYFLTCFLGISRIPQIYSINKLRYTWSLLLFPLGTASLLPLLKTCSVEWNWYNIVMLFVSSSDHKNIEWWCFLCVVFIDIFLKIKITWFLWKIYNHSYLKWIHIQNWRIKDHLHSWFDFALINAEKKHRMSLVVWPH